MRGDSFEPDREEAMKMPINKTGSPLGITSKARRRRNLYPTREILGKYLNLIESTEMLQTVLVRGGERRCGSY